LVLTDSQVVLASACTVETTSQPKSTITDYHVKQGDTLSGICKRFNVSLDSIKVSNGLTSDTIQPGKLLIIPSQSGVIAVVHQGDTLIGLVSKFSGNLQKTISVNSLGAADRIYSEQRILIVDGKAPSVQVASSSSSSSSSSNRQSLTSSITVHASSGPNKFPYGWCTWYVASRRYVPWRGNAKQWPASARAYGYSVGRVPVPGAILVTGESWWGHVAYVESVHGSTITVSEMNYVGWGRISTRTLSASYGIYIY
jgi:surface antigen